MFQTGKWYEACGNTAAMVGESWLGKHFEVIGDRSRHFGKFAGCGRQAAAPAAAVGASEGVNAAGGSCCT